MPSSNSAPSTPAYVRTCNLCRQRRVKCDRQFPRCSTCVRSEAECVYPLGRGRAPKRPGQGVVPQLSERLTRLESIISQLGATEEQTGGQTETKATNETQQHPLDPGFSRLKIDASKSYYVNNALWVTLSNEVEELGDFLFEPASEGGDEIEPPPSPPSTTTTSATPFQTGLNAAIFGYRAVASSLRHLHPSPPHAAALFAAFTNNIAPLVHIFHMPTLTRAYRDAMGSLDALDKNTETLLFAIHYSAVISLTPEQCSAMLGETRESALERYRFAVEQAMARGDLLSTQSMMMLQAVVLFLSALPNEDDSRAAWSLTSLAYHIARTMGLHRDGTAFRLRPLETELRRRLWWQICIIDSRSSEYHCNEPFSRGYASDTKPPLHVDDVDLTPDMAQPPPERWDKATDMTLSLVRCEAIQTGWKLGQLTNNAPDASPVRQEAIATLETRLRDRYLPICDSSVPFQLLASSVARIVLGRFWLVTHYAVASHSNKRLPLDPGAHDALFARSIGILEASGTLLADPSIQQWTWYSKTHIQWGAMAFVLAELCVRSRSVQCDHAWDCVDTVYNGWRVLEHRDDERRLALWRPIQRLMARARSVREMQTTAVAGCRSEESSSNSNIPGVVSATSDTLLSDELSSSPFIEPFDGLQRVSGTETLDPFMDLLASWPWTDTDADLTDIDSTCPLLIRPGFPN